MEGFFLEPLGERMIVQPDDFEYKGRLVIPEKYKGKTTTGTIIAMGEPHEKLKVGDRILYEMFSGGEIGFNDGTETKNYRHLTYNEVIAIVKTKEGTVRI
jgi:co-chaperonin GroES (HSP10)